MFLSNAQKGIFSEVERDVLKSAKKVPLKKGVFKLSGRHFIFYWLEGVKGLALFHEYLGLNSLIHSSSDKYGGINGKQWMTGISFKYSRRSPHDHSRKRPALVTTTFSNRWGGCFVESFDCKLKGKARLLYVTLFFPKIIQPFATFFPLQYFVSPQKVTKMLDSAHHTQAFTFCFLF